MSGPRSAATGSVFRRRDHIVPAIGLGTVEDELGGRVRGAAIAVQMGSPGRILVKSGDVRSCSIMESGNGAIRASCARSI